MLQVNKYVNIRQQNIKRTKIYQHFILVSGPKVYNSSYNFLRT